MGEICPHCLQPATAMRSRGGWISRAINRILSLPRLEDIPIVYLCDSKPGEAGPCRMIIFAAGLGGTTHGICEECDAEQHRILDMQKKVIAAWRRKEHLQ